MFRRNKFLTGYQYRVRTYTFHVYIHFIQLFILHTFARFRLFVHEWDIYIYIYIYLCVCVCG